ncbi:hypothetical protein [Undibacterium sp. Rencai35W]|uniref:hypothetical protein n=1 Tax=Undibacterium sp. Rencai35W TaxID=3413046 RepID=UPI003BF61397
MAYVFGAHIESVERLCDHSTHNANPLMKRQARQSLIRLFKSRQNFGLLLILSTHTPEVALDMRTLQLTKLNCDFLIALTFITIELA